MYDRGKLSNVIKIFFIQSNHLIFSFRFDCVLSIKTELSSCLTGFRELFCHEIKNIPYVKMFDREKLSNIFKLRQTAFLIGNHKEKRRGELD